MPNYFLPSPFTSYDLPSPAALFFNTSTFQVFLIYNASLHLYVDIDVSIDSYNSSNELLVISEACLPGSPTGTFCNSWFPVIRFGNI